MTEAENRRKAEDTPDVPDRGDETPPTGGRPPDRPRRLTIRIDRKEYRVPPELLDRGRLTGQQIRRLADPNIGPERDLFEVVPGGSDRKIADDEWVVIRNHLRFFSAPAVINPGAVGVRTPIWLGDIDSTDGGPHDATE